MRRTFCLLAIALAAMAVGISVTQLSSATFTSQSANIATIDAAADWAPPVVSLADPGNIGCRGTQIVESIGHRARVPRT